MRKRLAFTVLAFAFGGCQSVSPAQKAEWEAQASKPITCSAGQDCDIKWGRALQWVLNHSKYKILSQSEMMISTMGPLPDDPSPAYTVTKISSGGGIYTLDFRGGCDNVFGCIPSLLEAKVDFINTVLAPHP